MKRIFKYPIRAVYTQDLQLPAGSKILSVENQDETIVLYALVEDSNDIMQSHQIIIHGTGHPADDVLEATFVGTVKMHNGRLMFHVFTRRNFHDKSRI